MTHDEAHQAAVLLKINLVNLSGEGLIEEVWQHLEENLPGIVRYRARLRLDEPQEHDAIGLTILTSAASVITIARALWSGYERFVKPYLDKRGNESGGVVIEVTNGANAFRLQKIAKEAHEDVTVSQCVENLEFVAREDPTGFRDLQLKLSRSGQFVQVGGTSESEEDEA
jgi:hypothetical protein